MLPSLVIYAKVQHGNHNNPRLEGLFYVTKFGNPCKNPTWEPEQSKVGRSHVMLPSLVIYVKSPKRPTTKIQGGKLLYCYFIIIILLY